MRVVVVGTGYVGLVSGACLADFGNRVVCIDKDAAKIAALARGEIQSTIARLRCARCARSEIRHRAEPVGR